MNSSFICFFYYYRMRKGYFWIVVYSYPRNSETTRISWNEQPAGANWEESKQQSLGQGSNAMSKDHGLHIEAEKLENRLTSKHLISIKLATLWNILHENSLFENWTLHEIVRGFWKKKKKTVKNLGGSCQNQTFNNSMFKFTNALEHWEVEILQTKFYWYQWANTCRWKHVG